MTPRSEAPASERTSPKLRFDGIANEVELRGTDVPKPEPGNKWEGELWSAAIHRRFCVDGNAQTPSIRHESLKKAAMNRRTPK
jgi:hypothetical protein